MEHMNTNPYANISQPSILIVDALFPAFNEEQPLEDLLETSQHENQSDFWPLQSFSLALNDRTNLYWSSEPWSIPDPLRTEVPSISLASNPTTFMELDLNETVTLDSDDPKDLLRCPETGCDDQRIYATPSTFRKHQAKHTRPYACKYSSCNFRRFGNKAGLTRHCREVHGSKTHYCPFRSCIRNTEGFARKYNLLKHQIDCHGDEPSRQLTGSSSLSVTDLLEHDDGLMQFGRSPDEGSDRASEELSVAETSYEYSGGDDRIERKLRHLRAKRDGINRDIEMLENAQTLVMAK